MADCNGCSGGHGHSHAAEGGEERYVNLLKFIDVDRIECLNEDVDGSGRSVFRTWEDRFDRSHFVDSPDDDPELLFNIPFTANVRLAKIVVIGEDRERSPAELSLYSTANPVTFDQLQSYGEPDQRVQLLPDCRGMIEYPAKPTKFSNVSRIAMYFGRSFGGSSTRITYIGLFGEFSSQLQREGIVIVNYESAPNPADHIRLPGTGDVTFDLVRDAK